MSRRQMHQHREVKDLPSSWRGPIRRDGSGSPRRAVFNQRELLGATLGRPTAIALAFLLGVWVTFVDIQEWRSRAGDCSVGSAEAARAPQTSAGDILPWHIGSFTTISQCRHN